jgi:thioesterase domain-containing protein
MGGIIAMCMTYLLEQQGERVAFLGLLDTGIPSAATQNQEPMVPDNSKNDKMVLAYVKAFARIQGTMDRKIDGMEIEEKLSKSDREHLANISADLSDRECYVYAALWGQEHGLWDNVSADLMNFLYTDSENSAKLMSKLALRRVSAPIHIWWTKNTIELSGGNPGDWTIYTEGGVITEVVGGNHEEIVSDPYVHERINQALRAVYDE